MSLLGNPFLQVLFPIFNLRLLFYVRLMGAGMCDRLIEDIVSVTETLMVADVVDIEAYAHPDAKLTVNDKINRINQGLDNHAGKARLDKVAKLRAKLSKHQAGDGVFKRGAC